MTADSEGLKIVTLVIDDRQCVFRSLGYDPMVVDVRDLTKACRLHRGLGAGRGCQTLAPASAEFGLDVGFIPLKRLALPETENPGTGEPKRNTSCSQQPCAGRPEPGIFRGFDKDMVAGSELVPEPQNWSIQ